MTLDPIRAALERAARELTLLADAAAQAGFDASARRARNEAHAARAALAQPELPADGEVAELVTSEIARCLRTKAATEKANSCHYSAALLTRAADLLERLSDGPAVQSREPASVVEQPTKKQLHDLWLELYSFHEGPTSGDVEEIARAIWERWGTPALQPIPVTERLPEEGDCDSSLCWQMVPIPDINGRCMMGRWELRHRNWLSDPDADGVATHWLPFQSLPIPRSEENLYG